jgi:hypothetical protein
MNLIYLTQDKYLNQDFVNTVINLRTYTESTLCVSFKNKNKIKHRQTQHNLRAL